MSDIKRTLDLITEYEKVDEAPIPPIGGAAGKVGTRAAARAEPRIDTSKVGSGTKVEPKIDGPEPSAAPITPKTRSYEPMDLEKEFAARRAAKDVVPTEPEVSNLPKGINRADVIGGVQKGKYPGSQYVNVVNPETGKVEKKYISSLLGKRGAGAAYGLGKDVLGTGLKAGKWGLEHPGTTAIGGLVGASELERQGYLEPGTTAGAIKGTGEFVANTISSLGPQIGTAAAGAGAKVVGGLADVVAGTKKSADSVPPATPSTQPPSIYHPAYREPKESMERQASEKVLTEFNDYIKNL